ncbi:MAG: Rieske (2Fe-2S) protein [Planctomycetota bacterium]
MLGVGATAVWGTPLTLEGGGASWKALGSLERFPEGVPVKVPVVGVRQDAWARSEAETLGNVIVRREGEAVHVLSATCPHNGCDVFCRAADSLFCPCHDSDFAPDGSVRTGPSPRGLDPLEAKVEDGEVHVRFVRFEVGTDERRPL